MKATLSHNFIVLDKAWFKEPQASECPWTVAEKRANKCSYTYIIVALIVLLIQYPYSNLDYCKSNPAHYVCRDNSITDNHSEMWLLLFPTIFMFEMAKPMSGILELLLSIVIVGCSVFTIVSTVALIIIKNTSGAYHKELNARYVDPHGGDNLSEYLYNITEALNEITEIEEVAITNRGIHTTPPYSKLSYHSRNALWYFDHIVKDSNIGGNGPV